MAERVRDGLGSASGLPLPPQEPADAHPGGRDSGAGLPAPLGRREGGLSQIGRQPSAVRHVGRDQVHPPGDDWLGLLHTQDNMRGVVALSTTISNRPQQCNDPGGKLVGTLVAKRRSHNPELTAFGDWLRTLRGANSREAISLRLKALGVPLGASTLVQYEKGTVWAPDPGVLWGLCTIYRQPIDLALALLRANRAQPDVASASDLLRHAGEYKSPSDLGGADGGAFRDELGEIRARVAVVEGVLSSTVEDVRAIGSALDHAERRASTRGNRRGVRS